jgi:cell division protein FtsB
VRFDFVTPLSWVGLTYWIMFSVVFGYFAYHVMGGENGLLSYYRTKRIISVKSKELKSLRSKCDVISRNVALLSSGSLDLDLLEERCMVVLNYCHSGDIVVR